MPLTIHAAWLIRAESPAPDGELFVWAEYHAIPGARHRDPDGSAARNGRPTHHRTSNGRGRIPSHPAQVPVGQLRPLLGPLSGGIVPETRPANTVVWLPTRHGEPQTRTSSLGMVHLQDRDAQVPVHLAAWQVTGLVLGPMDALTFLASLQDRRRADVVLGQTYLRHIRLGNDLRFWGHAAKFTLEILAGQHYLPGLQADAQGGFHSLWTPYLMESRLQEQVARLLEAMPPVCRAYGLEALDQAPAPDHLLEHFLATLVDRAVRLWTGDLPRVGDSPGALWLESLQSPQNRLPLPPQPAHRLYQDWVSWLEQLRATAWDAQVRVAFELEPPELDLGNPETLEKDALWTLHYCLQAQDDPEIRVPAEEVWRTQGTSLRVDGRRFDQPQERLLAGLGAASRLFPPIQESLRTSRPIHVRLTTAQAYQFLRDAGPLLASSGFGVILPSWWHRQEVARLGLRLRLFSPEPDSSDGHAVRGPEVRYRWDLTLGDQVLSPEEFERLASLDTPLIHVGGRWVELDPEQVAVARRFLEHNRTEGRIPLLQAIRLAQVHRTQADEAASEVEGGRSWLPVDGLDLPELLPLEQVQIQGWLEQALDRLRGVAPLEELEEPEGFVGRLRPYQRRGLAWLVTMRELGLGACLADDMGLGKTIQAIALLLHTRNQAAARGERLAPSLLVCPTSVVTNWRHEVERFAPGLRVLAHHGSGRRNGHGFQRSLAQYDLVITSYGTARRDLELLEQVHWSDVILDEAQNIKNPAAKQTQAVRRLRADNRVALTGTPVENRLLELWSIMEFLNPGYLGRRERFRKQFVLPIERYNDPGAAATLRRLVQPFLLRRLKTDPSILSDLPEKNEMVVYCSLTPEQIALYDRVVRETLEHLDAAQGIQRRGQVLALLTKLKQICNHPAHYLGQKGPLRGRSGKLTRLAEMLEEVLESGHRALVFTQFVEMGQLLKAHLEELFGQEVLFLHGGLSAAQRGEMVRLFQEERNAPPIFVLSLRAGGLGLNLTRANHVFHFDRWWNPAVENQATDRAFRIGQQRSVQVYKFVVAGTLEERIHELIESKQNLAEAIVGSGEDWLAELDTEELRRLLELRRDAVDAVEVLE